MCHPLLISPITRGKVLLPLVREGLAEGYFRAYTIAQRETKKQALEPAFLFVDTS